MTKDIAINFYSDEEGVKAFSFGGPTPQPVEGLTKLLNHWLKALFTAVGSDPIDKEAGSNFSQLIGSNIGLVDELFEVVTISLDQASETVLRNQRQQDLPESEQFGGVTLQELSEDGADGLLVEVILENVLGQALLIQASV